jgi:hypothetical protein
LASPFGKAPREGQYQIPAEIDWGAMGGADKVVSFNLQNSGDTKAITQICAVHVDNSDCGADIQFIFTDTAETITVPAYTPYFLVPIFSRSLQFFVAGGVNNTEVLSTDVTRFSMFNFVPPPVTLDPSTQEQNASSAVVIPAQAAASFGLISAFISGTIEMLQVYISMLGGGAVGQVDWHLEDGNGTLLGGIRNLSNGDNTSYSEICFNLQNARLRFQGGLKFVIDNSTVPAGSFFTANVYYRTP